MRVRSPRHAVALLAWPSRWKLATGTRGAFTGGCRGDEETRFQDGVCAGLDARDGEMAACLNSAKYFCGFSSMLDPDQLVHAFFVGDYKSSSTNRRVRERVGVKQSQHTILAPDTCRAIRTGRSRTSCGGGRAHRTAGLIAVSVPRVRTAGTGARHAGSARSRAVLLGAWRPSGAIHGDGNLTEIIWKRVDSCIALEALLVNTSAIWKGHK
ncbi:hypothetical protein B0H19DRAFT_1077004 [Mycena capillaripes]|nr:hypothetical protein B0H19DRAFT_1077004 [Mycena capillaripes]